MYKCAFLAPQNTVAPLHSVQLSESINQKEEVQHKSLMTE